MRVEKTSTSRKNLLCRLTPVMQSVICYLTFSEISIENGKVDMADIVLLIRYQAGWSISIYEKNCRHKCGFKDKHGGSRSVDPRGFVKRCPNPLSAVRITDREQFIAGAVRGFRCTRNIC